MNLFVYSELTSSQQDFLSRHAPPTAKISFRQEKENGTHPDAFQNAEVLFGNPPAEWFQQTLANLKFWQIDSAGFDQYKQVLVQAVVSNMGDFYSLACAETMLAGLLAFYRGLPTLVRLQTEKVWMGKELRPSLHLLTDKKIIILGAGSIGMALKNMLSAFSRHVQLTARQNPLADIFSKDELYRRLPDTDVVVNTLPGHLHNYVSRDFLQRMKPGSLYASVGRGNTTDETALIEELQSGKLLGAILDVTEQEPLPSSSPLWTMENVLLTQHTGGGQQRETEGKIERFLFNLRFFMQGETVPDQVELERGY